MANYATFESADTLYQAVIAPVKPGWLVGGAGVPAVGGGRIDTVTPLRNTLGCLLRIARGSTSTTFLPDPRQVLASLSWFSPADTRVVVIGQSPYHQVGQPCGVAFQSYADRAPMSAVAIGGNLAHYGHIDPALTRCTIYETWMRQGVLLYNVIPTTEVAADTAHAWIWDENRFSDNILSLIPRDTVAILLGRAAQDRKGSLRSRSVVEHAHPAARGGDFNSKDVFGEANRLLATMGHQPINWTPGRAARP